MSRYGLTMIPSRGRIEPVVLPFYTAEENSSLQRGSRPYTVVEILQETFKQDFRKTLQYYLDKYPEAGEKAVGVEGSRDYKLVWLSQPKVESSLQQPACTTAVDLVFSASVSAMEPLGEDANGDTVFDRRLFSTGFRVRYYIGLWEKTCSVPMIAPAAYFPSDFITEQKTSITNQYLLPIMYAEDYPKAARRMLERYYKEALEKPTAVDGRKLARNMHLDVRVVRFPKGSDIQGRIYFDWTWVAVRDKDGRTTKEKIPPMTILINADLCPTPEIENSTIIHECVHVFLDLPFFKLQMLGGKPYTSYTSRRKSGKRYNTSNGPIDWMELQAEKLPAYVLMEEENTRKLIEKFLSERNGDRSPETMNWIMQSLASFFNVSKSMAKYRMIELGYPEAEGIYVYVDNQHIPDHGCGNEWKNGVTYTIARGDAAQLISDSGDFCIALSSGCYVYAEGHYCLDDEKYIDERYKYEKRLTAYARHHIEECCISFSVRGRYTNAKYEDGQAARKKEEKNKYQTRHALDAEPESKEWVLQKKRYADDASIWWDLQNNMPDSFQKAVQDIIDKKGISQNELAMRTGVSRATLRKWCVGKPSLRHVVALCISMDVRADIGMELVRLTGHSFMNNLEHKLLKSMLFETNALTIPKANDIMRQNNLPPLTCGEDEQIAC